MLSVKGKEELQRFGEAIKKRIWNSKKLNP
jgi:hypothetical protein